MADTHDSGRRRGARDAWGLHSCPLRSARINWRRVDDEVVLLDVDTGACTTLNAVAAILWDRCDGTSSLDEMIEEIVDEFGVPREQAETDVTDFISAMLGRGLLLL